MIRTGRCFPRGSRPPIAGTRSIFPIAGSPDVLAALSCIGSSVLAVQYLSVAPQRVQFRFFRHLPTFVSGTGFTISHGDLFAAPTRLLSIDRPAGFPHGVFYRVGFPRASSTFKMTARRMITRIQANPRPFGCPGRFLPSSAGQSFCLPTLPLSGSLPAPGRTCPRSRWPDRYRRR